MDVYSLICVQQKIMNFKPLLASIFHSAYHYHITLNPKLLAVERNSREASSDVLLPSFD